MIEEEVKMRTEFFIRLYKGKDCMMVGIDRYDCFDKPSRCPIVLPVPKTQEQIQFIIDKIEWLMTEEGYTASEEYEEEKWIRDYPEDIITG